MSALLPRSEQDYARVASQRMTTKIGEPFITRDQAPVVSLDLNPEHRVGASLQSLLADRGSIVAPITQHLCDRSGQVLVDLNSAHETTRKPE